MQPFTYFAIYCVVWWMCLFVVLPFRVHNQVDTGEYIQGTERGKSDGIISPGASAESSIEAGG